VERRPQGQQLVERDAERVDVGALIDRRRAHQLLGRHVRYRSERRSRARELRRSFERGEPEVEQHDAALHREHDVRGLDVAVQHAGGVRMLECLRDLEHDPEAHLHPACVRGSHRRQQLAGHTAGGALCDHAIEVGTGETLGGLAVDRRQDVGERASLDVLHREVGDALLLADGVHGDDPGMLQARHGLDLAAKALVRARKVQLLGSDQLEGHRAIERLLAREVDHAHAALAEPAQQPEVPEPLGERRCRLARWCGEETHALQPRELRTDRARVLRVREAHRLDAARPLLLEPAKALDQEQLDFFIGRRRVRALTLRLGRHQDLRGSDAGCHRRKERATRVARSPRP
jgi:hypothetical protein